MIEMCKIWADKHRCCSMGMSMIYEHVFTWLAVVCSIVSVCLCA